jgi:hypothetical protein
MKYFPSISKRHVRWLVFVVILACLIMWATYAQYSQNSLHEEGWLTNEKSACAQLISPSDFVHVCPSAADRSRLRVVSTFEKTGHVNQCSVSITADGANTLHIVIDAFLDDNAAEYRMWERMHDGSSGEGNLLTAPGAYGNLLGFNERSAMDKLFNNRNLLLWREHVYAEVMPTGGGLCPNEELFDLGRFIYEKMSLFPKAQSANDSKK